MIFFVFSPYIKHTFWKTLSQFHFTGGLTSSDKWTLLAQDNDLGAHGLSRLLDGQTALFVHVDDGDRGEHASSSHHRGNDSPGYHCRETCTAWENILVHSCYSFRKTHILIKGDKINRSGNVSLDLCKQNHPFGECCFWAAVWSKARAVGRVTAAAT